MAKKILSFHYVSFITISILITSTLLGNGAKKSLRVVSLAPSLTEILYSLGLEESIVGTTNYCNYPKEAKKTPKVGTYINPNLELILRSKPDFILASYGTSPEVISRIRELGFKVIYEEIKNIDELPKFIISLGKQLGVKKVSIKLSKKIQRAIKTLSHKKRNSSYLLLLQLSPLISITSNTWLGSILHKAGFKNVVPDGRIKYPQLSKEFLIKKNPEYIFVDPNALTKSKKSMLKEAKMHLKAIYKSEKRPSKIIILPSDILMRPGPRIVDGIKFITGIDK